MSSPSTPLAASSIQGEAMEKEEKPLKSVEEIQEAAVGKISSCCQLALVSGVVGSASALWESYQRNNVVFDLTVPEQTKFFVSLFNFIFGLGLYQVYQLFQETRGVDRMKAPKLLQLYKTLARLWLGVAVLFNIDSFFLSDELKVPNLVGISTLLIAGSVPLGEWLHRRALNKEEQPAVAEDYSTGRRVGLGAARNMLWAVGAMFIAALLESVDYTVQTMQAEGTGDKVGVALNGLMEVSESIIIGGLLASLYSTLMRAVLMSTQRKFSSKDPSFKEYFQAQIKFYGRVGSYFGFQAGFTVLGYVVQLGQILWFKFVG